jgi:hypothetical protein
MHEGKRHVHRQFRCGEIAIVKYAKNGTKITLFEKFHSV